MHLSKSKQESLTKSFLLFFTVMELFLAFIFYNYYKLEEEHLSESLFLEMKNYSFFFDNDKFQMDIVPSTKNQNYYELYFDNRELYILVPFKDDENSSLAILYPLDKYKSQLNKIKERLFIQLMIFSFISALVSLLFSAYTLKPIKDALFLLEEFIRDIIHDLNTPITSILINLKMMKHTQEADSIAQSANAIAMLHKNLDVYLKDSKFEKEPTEVDKLLKEQIDYFKSLYGYLDWNLDIEKVTIDSNDIALSRIIYNLLSNACKYNTSNGFIKIELTQYQLTITNDSYGGIKNPKRVFERFYKESDRGIGIGLHIVEKLCGELKIEKSLEVEGSLVKVRLHF